MKLKYLVGIIPRSEKIGINEKTSCRFDEVDWNPLAEPLNRYSSANEYLTYLKQETTKAQKEVNSLEAKMEQQHQLQRYLSEYFYVSMEAIGYRLGELKLV